MSRAISTAQTMAEMLVPSMATFMSILPGSYQIAEDRAPKAPAAITSAIFMRGA